MGGLVKLLGRFIVVSVIAASIPARGQITRTATFENFAADSSFQPSFTDPLSGIAFRNSTHPPAPGDFDVNHSNTFFGGGNYLTSGGLGESGLGSFFGFTADLPSAANHVGLEALYLFDARSNVSLQGFNSNAMMVAQQSGPSGMSNASFPLQISSSQFDIVTIRIVVGTGAAAYDNISATVVPEPATMACGFAALCFLLTRKR